MLLLQFAAAVVAVGGVFMTPGAVSPPDAPPAPPAVAAVAGAAAATNDGVSGRTTEGCCWGYAHTTSMEA